MLYSCLVWKLRNKRVKMIFLNTKYNLFSLYLWLPKKIYIYKYSCFAYIYGCSQVVSWLNGLLYYFIVIKDGSGFFV